MDIIKSTIQDKISLPTKLSTLLRNKNFCFFDIETTGLNKRKDAIILAGILYSQNNSIKIIQLFANKLDDEYELLNSLKKILSDFDYFITYNGYTFDIPFVNYRLKHHNINFSLSNNHNIDVLKFVRKNKELLNLSNCKLKSVEHLLNISREDKISGKESTELYLQYIKNNDDKLKNIIIKHNHDDIYYLSKILKVYEMVYELGNHNLKVNYNNLDIEFNIDFANPIIKENMLYISGSSTVHSLHDVIYYDENLVFKWIPTQGNIEIRLQVNNGMLSDNSNCCYIDKQDYSFNINFSDNTEYQVPDNIILIKIGKAFMLDNLKKIIENLFENLISL